MQAASPYVGAVMMAIVACAIRSGLPAVADHLKYAAASSRQCALRSQSLHRVCQSEDRERLVECRVVAIGCGLYL